MPRIRIAPGGEGGAVEEHAGSEAALQSERRISPQKTEAFVQGLNDAIKLMGTKLSFSVDDSTGRTIVKVVDAETNEVIRQIPPEELLVVAHRINKLMGVFFNRAA
jgi:flagellar protein FlaG